MEEKENGRDLKVKQERDTLIASELVEQVWRRNASNLLLPRSRDLSGA